VRPRPLLVLVGALLGAALPAATYAHDGHAGDASGPLSAPPFVVGAAALLAASIVLGGFALSRSRRGSDGPSRRLMLGAAVLLVPGALLAGAAWSEAGGEHASSSGPGAYEGTALSGPAPGFELTDQRSERLALSDLRGRVVVLAFLDPHCTDICPLTAAHFKRVHDVLGEDAARVALLAVNINPEANALEDVAAASEKWTIDGVPAWHFLTGTAEELEGVWRAYTVYGGSPKAGKPGEVAHSPGVYVIDPAGEKRWYVSIPQDALLDEPWEGPTFDELLLRHVGELLRE
jgi:protein SCO1/2